MAGVRDTAYQIRMPLRHPADDEERGPRLVPREHVEQAIHAADDPGLETIPIGTTHARFKRRHLEILFDVDSEVMPDHAYRGLQRACPAIREGTDDADSPAHHAALRRRNGAGRRDGALADPTPRRRWHRLCHRRSEEHTSELQSQSNLVCRLLLEKKKKTNTTTI